MSPLNFITTFIFQDKLHKCPICKKGFSTQNDLKVHQMTSHQTIPSTPPFLPFKCHLCDKMFQNDVALRAHFLNHLSTSQQLVGKGPFFHYIKGILRLFLNHPPIYVRTFSLHKVRVNCHFLDHRGWAYVLT